MLLPRAHGGCYDRLGRTAPVHHRLPYRLLLRAAHLEEARGHHGLLSLGPQEGVVLVQSHTGNDYSPHLPH
jgi:hypothetical protein